MLFKNAELFNVVDLPPAADASISTALRSKHWQGNILRQICFCSTMYGI
jgi:hypothetical protein